MALLWVDRYVRQWEFSCAEEGGLLILNGVGADALSRDGHGSAVPPIHRFHRIQLEWACSLVMR